jgi:hypothetical protein
MAATSGRGKCPARARAAGYAIGQRCNQQRVRSWIRIRVRICFFNFSHFFSGRSSACFRPYRSVRGRNQLLCRWRDRGEVRALSAPPATGAATPSSRPVFTGRNPHATSKVGMASVMGTTRPTHAKLNAARGVPYRNRTRVSALTGRLNGLRLQPTPPPRCAGDRTANVQMTRTAI